MNFLELHQQFKESNLFGRYITLQHIEPIIAKYPHEIIGESVLGKPVYKLQLGTGKLKILMWSQMHGNESTTTKALFDFINLLQSGNELSKELLSNFTFCMLPMLNPDGAELYTRENANNIDLNRDANNLTQVESQILRREFEAFQPDYCYNLHDQRTIFGVDDTGPEAKPNGAKPNPATVSFLSPAYNENREVNEVRIKAMNIIVAMNETLQRYIPNQVGRFDDTFNINCIGDTFQHLNVPTILFEAGHFPNDYEREETRKYIFIALVSGLENRIENDIVCNRYSDYMNIPQNKVVFYDFVYKNIKINYDKNEIITNFAIQFKEELFEDQICFNAYIVEMGKLENYLGHFEYDAKEAQYSDDLNNIPILNQKADFYLDSIKIVNGMKSN